jgi:voltage-gated potassium channel Kch
VMLFGDIVVSTQWLDVLRTVFIIQNMLCSLLLFLHAQKATKIAAFALVILGTIATIYTQFHSDVSNYFFVVIYLLYFLLVSFQLFSDLLVLKKLGIETISAAFSGFILIGTVSSIIFATMDSYGAFRGPDGAISFADYTYFSFVTLLTIGYGDIVPVTEIARKSIILIGLIGHFYTVFVVGIVIGKFLKDR